ncbi:MAG: tetratricopeptide repeat protein [Pseudomonadota bacterium]
MKNKLFYLVAILALGAAAAAIVYWRRGPEIKPVRLSPPVAMEAIQQRGEAAYRQQMYAPLIETYKKMLEKTPDSAELKRGLALSYFGAARYAEAGPLLKEVARDPVADAEVFYELGFIAGTEGKTDEAIEFLKRALEINPDHTGAGEMLRKLSSDRQ